MNRESRRSHEPHVVTQPGRDKPRQWVEEAGIIEENNSMKRNQHSARWAVTMLREEDQVVRSPSVPQGQPPYSSRAATQGSTRNQPLPPSPPPLRPTQRTIMGRDPPRGGPPPPRPRRRRRRRGARADRPGAQRPAGAVLAEGVWGGGRRRRGGGHGAGCGVWCEQCTAGMRGERRGGRGQSEREMRGRGEEAPSVGSGRRAEQEGRGCHSGWLWCERCRARRGGREWWHSCAGRVYSTVHYCNCTPVGR